jgi:hypothetical protein
MSITYVADCLSPRVSFEKRDPEYRTRFLTKGWSPFSIRVVPLDELSIVRYSCSLGELKLETSRCKEENTNWI